MNFGNKHFGLVSVYFLMKIGRYSSLKVLAFPTYIIVWFRRSIGNFLAFPAYLILCFEFC